jgi:hypothetical protein
MKRLFRAAAFAGFLAAAAALPRLWHRLRSLKPSQKLTDLSKEELYSRAQEADIPGRSGMTKQELADALKER